MQKYSFALVSLCLVGLAQAVFYFPQRHKRDPFLSGSLDRLIYGDDDNATRSERNITFDNSTEHGPGRFKFKNDTFISDYIPINPDGYEIYFLLAESRSNPETDPLVFWFQGGPGCSSMLALWTENGPYTYRFNSSSIKDRARFEYNPYSWNNKANVIYIDQPMGTGFSFSKGWRSLRTNTDLIAQDFYHFLGNFKAKYPQFAKNDLYLTGESFAGHYIPAIANYLHEEKNVKISGLAIGNGWVDPFYQYPSYPEFAHSEGIIKAGHEKVLDLMYQFCRMSLVLGVPILSTYACQMTGASIAAPVYPDFSVYDIREPCVTPGLCLPDDHLWEVLNAVDYRSKFGIPLEKQWEMCAGPAHTMLMLDMEKMYGYKLAPLLDDGVPILIYNGDKDYICNWMGGLKWTEALEWTGQAAYNEAEVYRWTTQEGNAGGMTKKFGSFTFLRVFDAGHMVPTDQPESAYSMINEFLNTQTITGSQRVS